MADAKQSTRRPPTKSSVGIIVCRRNFDTGRPEVLLARKRYSYALSDFVHGRYIVGGREYCRRQPPDADARPAPAPRVPPARPPPARPSPARPSPARPPLAPQRPSAPQRPPLARPPPAPQRPPAPRPPPLAEDNAARFTPPLNTVAELLNGMTREELFDVWSLNFEQIWYRVWLTCENRELFNRKNAKFQSTFMRDGGKGLRQLIAQARANGRTLWEVPKGRRLNAREANVICAVRETHEETDIGKGDYRILPGVRRRVSYVDNKVRYNNIYYIAIANPRLENARGDAGTLALARSIHQMAEVSEVRWCDIEHLRLLDEKGRLEALVGPAIRLAKTYYRGRWAARVPGFRRTADAQAGTPK